MCKLSLRMLCIGVALFMSSGVYAKGGSYHHADPVFPKSVESPKPKGWVLRYSRKHHHYHVTHKH